MSASRDAALASVAVAEASYKNGFIAGLVAVMGLKEVPTTALEAIVMLGKDVPPSSTVEAMRAEAEAMP